MLSFPAVRDRRRRHCRPLSTSTDSSLEYEPLMAAQKRRRSDGSMGFLGAWLDGTSGSKLSAKVKRCYVRSGIYFDKESAASPDHFNGIFILDSAHLKPEKEDERKIKGILERLRHYGIDNIVESNVEYALKMAPGGGSDGEAAFRLLMLLEDTYEGLVKPYNPSTKLLGAVNRDGVTCYLDALLFAMFAKLDSFEAMLYDSFEDAKRRKLAGLLRLWVNLLRSGKLITTDITHHLQDALADCGWQEAARLRQQDPSEAFTFITGKLELPLLTLKMDLYHTGKEDPQDDHKFINERLLEVAILDEPPEGNAVIKLEDCLEHYFNNRIEVKRHLEHRRNTLKSANSNEIPVEKHKGVHIEVAELVGTPNADSPLAQSPTIETMPALEGVAVESQAAQSKNPVERLRPTSGRKRTDSIFSQRKVELEKEKIANGKAEESTDTKDRKMSTRTEILMPAWQFFKLLPWYTDHMPRSDAQVAAHFARKRPVLGICLKRYSYTMTGQAKRLSTYVDIPLEVAVPNFVSDDNMDDDGPLVGNFRLLLQSVVCHRGVSVNSGHYISLCRGRLPHFQRPGRGSDHHSGTGSDSEDEAQDPWMRFDDLAKNRITYVDIREALKQETPYLLFYQVVPIGDDGHSIHDLPTYAEATSRSHSDAMPLEKAGMLDMSGSDILLTTSNTEVPGTITSEPLEAASVSRRTSSEVYPFADISRGRSSQSIGEEQRKSLAFDEASLTNPTAKPGVVVNSTPSTPPEDKSSNFLAVANKIGSRRGSKGGKGGSSKSRGTSLVRGDTENTSRFTLNMSKLTQRMNKGDQSAATVPTIDDASQQHQRPHNESERAAFEATDKAMPLPTQLNGSLESIGTPKLSQQKDREKQNKQSKAKKQKGTRGDDDRECIVM